VTDRFVSWRVEKARRALCCGVLVFLAVVLATFSARVASAQMGGMGGGGMGRGMGGAPGQGAPQQGHPTQTSPTKNNVVGPRAAEPSAEDEEEEVRSQLSQRTEPVLAPPANPLAVSPELRLRIGSDREGAIPSPVGSLHQSFFPYYEERRGEYRFRAIPPLWLEHTRGLEGPSAPGEPVRPDRESLFSLLYYQRRSPSLDIDLVFPFVWNVTNKDAGGHTVVVGPFLHRTAPFENDNWLAPLYFQGSRKEGGYFVSPALLTATRWDAKGAFTLSGIYFRSRTLSDVDWGVVPFYFHGDNGNEEGARKTYSFIPPLFYYHGTRESDESSTTVVGPVISQSTPKRAVFDIAPLFFHIEGKPETGGIRESHTTLFPFFHYGTSDAETLFVLPGYLRRVTKTVDTMVTPFYSHSETRSGATSLSLGGPVLPLFYNYSDRDSGLHQWFVAPLFMQSSSAEERAFLTPLMGRFETYGISRTWWFLPTLVVSTDQHGWETDFHPIVYAGRTDQSIHTVVAPVLWDFASPEHRTTIVAPIFWRFQDNTDGSITQIAGNTLYLQRRVAGGLDWQFHLLPLFSYGEDPQGYFWNVLFGLAGYQREGGTSRIRALWIPITVSTASARTAVEGGALRF
jgi:hypothetical protein